MISNTNIDLTKLSKDDKQKFIISLAQQLQYLINSNSAINLTTSEKANLELSIVYTKSLLANVQASLAPELANTLIKNTSTGSSHAPNTVLFTANTIQY
jgi:YbbR domain-containing protein